jgi:organic hydroperoxide reductase OsmC/OhrA
VSHEHVFDCRLTWTGAAKGPTKDYASYSREVRLRIEGKEELRASAAQVFRGDASLWNPEDMLVASLSTCHCLSYLALASRAGIRVVAYEDSARGTMDLVGGVIRFTRVVLRPKVTLALPSTVGPARGAERAPAGVEKALALHAKAHHECFIAASVNFPVETEPTVVLAES